ncbi:MAG: SusC/RagA family TonB-linked outer membrane protein [Mangrovibacterium sp.]
MKNVNLNFNYGKEARCFFRQLHLKAGLLLLLVMTIGIPNATAVSNMEFAREKQEQAEKRTVTGQVVDEKGKPLPGVTVVVQGTQIATVTDADGKYVIKASDKDALNFSFIGMKSKMILVENKKKIDVSLLSNTENLDEVVAVGFGKQKKESMVSAISTISSKELKTNSSNLTTALAGRVSGMISYQRSGEPGEDNAEFFIRGLSSFGSGKVDPLILIDGIESTSTDMARLQPDDIDQFSVLKDAAAAAVYGARGANGVVLITTKSGKAGKTKFDFRFENKVSTNTRNFQLADNITYMNLANEAALTRDPYAILPYSKSKIDNTAAGVNPYLYPSNNWIDQLIKPFTMNQALNLSVSGGTAKARYYVAGTYNVDNGVLQVDPINDFNSNIKLRNYSVRTNINLNITPTTEVIIRMYAQFDDYNGPVGGGSASFNRAIWSNPVMFPAVYPTSMQPYTTHPLFGGAVAARGSTTLLTNPYAEMVRGYQQYNKSNIMPQFEIKQDLNKITKGLSARMMAYVKRYSYYQVSRKYNPFYYQATEDPASGDVILNVLNDGGENSVGEVGREYLSYDEGGKDINSLMYMESALNYSRTFKEKHSVTGMLLFLMSSYQAGNSGSLQQSLPKRNMGLSGRFTYDYDSRYMAEFNFGYNGTEKFAEKSRFGFFPSFGVAWNISNEDFFAGAKNWMNLFKIRATYGIIGNDQIGSDSDRFFYLSEVNLDDGNYGATFGEDWGYSQNGVSINRYANENIGWEKSTQLNLGLDLEFWKTLAVTAEIYHQKRTNILQTRSYIGSSLGLQQIPESNFGEAATKGIDLTVNYNKFWNNGFYAQLRGNFTYATSEILKYDEVNYLTGQQYRSKIGNPTSQQYGYIAERLFIDQSEVDNSPTQFGDYVAGDIKYHDMNGDGVINDADQVPLGLPTTPEIVYGFGGTIGYKNWDFSIFFQGSARSSFFINPENISPFVLNGGAQNGLLTAVAESHWSETNRDSYAFWPRLSDYFIENNNQQSSWWMRNGSFLRLKNIELGYNMPESLMQRWNIGSMRVYLNASNLFAISNFKLWDPEMGGSGLGYPVQRVFNIGLQLSL